MTSEKNMFSFEKPEDNAGFLLWQVTMRWQRRVKHQLDTLGITHTQFVVMAALQWLSTQQKEVYQIDVAHHAQIDKMMTSKVFKTLEAKEIVLSTPGQGDKRTRAVRFTDSGRIVFKRSLAIVETTDRHFFSALGDQESPFVAAMQTLMNKNE